MTKPYFYGPWKSLMMFHADRFTPATLPALLCSCLAAVASVSSAQSFSQPAAQPDTVYVAQAKSYAYSGAPSESHVPYRTDPLRHGQQLEVYAETDSGWLRVRPPQGSFSWIAADKIDVDQTGQSGTVNEDQTVAWVGTQLGKARKYGWQVRLSIDESVTIIGRAEREGPNGPQLWYRIVPPSGEFRFVHRSQVVQTSEELVAALAGHGFEETGRKTAFIESMPSRSRPARLTSQEKNFHSHPSVESLTMEELPVSSRTRIEADANAVADAHDPRRSSRRVRPLVRAREGTDQDALAENRLAQAALQTPVEDSFHTRSAGPDAIGSGVATTSPLHSDGVSPLTPSLPPTLKRAVGSLSSASLSFLGRPRISHIDDGQLDSQHNLAGRNVSESTGPSIEEAFPQPSLPNNPAGNQTVVQVAGTQPLPAQNLTPNRSLRGVSPTTRPAVVSTGFSSASPRNLVVSQERLDQLRQQASSADVTGLRVLLSDLMTTQSSAQEAMIIADAAKRLANQLLPSPSQSTLALARRAEQYADLARQRDGAKIVQTMAVPSVPASNDKMATSLLPGSSSKNQAGSPSAPGRATRSDSRSGVIDAPQPPASAYSASGQLVEVYSARAHTPPFALIDATGRTIAYVTPSPGINLRMHLNRQITVSGQQGLVPGMNLPHVFAQTADRIASRPASFR